MNANLTSKQPDTPIGSYLCFVLQHANLVMSRQLDTALRPVGLTSRQLIVLGAVAEHDGLRQSMLADMTGKDRTTVTANLGPLIRRGLIVSTEDIDDRRARVIALTPTGRRLLARAREILERFDAKLCAQVQDLGGMRSFRDVLEAMSLVKDLEGDSVST